MPWKECDRMDERLRFVVRLHFDEKIVDVCAILIFFALMI
jgi:hypothetical protein